MATRPRYLLEESIKNEINLKKETRDGLGRRKQQKTFTCLVRHFVVVDKNQLPW